MKVAADGSIKNMEKKKKQEGFLGAVSTE